MTLDKVQTHSKYNEKQYIVSNDDIDLLLELSLGIWDDDGCSDSTDQGIKTESEVLAPRQTRPPIMGLNYQAQLSHNGPTFQQVASSGIHSKTLKKGTPPSRFLVTYRYFGLVPQVGRRKLYGANFRLARLRARHKLSSRRVKDSERLHQSSGQLCIKSGAMNRTLDTGIPNTIIYTSGCEEIQGRCETDDMDGCSGECTLPLADLSCMDANTIFTDCTRKKIDSLKSVLFLIFSTIDLILIYLMIRSFCSDRPSVSGL